ncbi:MAG TPA: type II toxin-antitoxin system antitoxin SocA domain-containing protein [Tepidisphaeraceae bacterium]|jgi:hypothetical protein|nr:type II toxin-antitoxin system antitoxin SocA domain-containing protein [Tepidisphaeraceae bacterium]
MPISSSDIIARISRAAVEARFPLGAVRSQKLLYLMECEYYRWEQKRLTSEQWIYYFYGPWSPTLDDLLKKEFNITPELLSDGRQINSITYDENEFYKLPDRFGDYSIQGIFERIIEEWLTRPLNELLDFVYFHTAPMRDAQRRQALDFSTIVSAKSEYNPINVYKLADKQRSRKEHLKTALANWLSQPLLTNSIRLPMDSAMIEAMKAMNDAEATPSIDGEIEIREDGAHRLSDIEEG